MEEIRKFRRDQVAAARTRESAAIFGVLTALVWLAAPCLLWQAMWVGWGYDSPTAQEQRLETIYLACAALCAFAAPLVVLVLGSIARYRWIVAVGALEVALSVVALFALFALFATSR